MKYTHGKPDIDTEKRISPHMKQIEEILANLPGDEIITILSAITMRAFADFVIPKARIGAWDEMCTFYREKLRQEMMLNGELQKDATFDPHWKGGRLQ